MVAPRGIEVGRHGVQKAGAPQQHRADRHTQRHHVLGPQPVLPTGALRRRPPVRAGHKHGAGVPWPGVVREVIRDFEIDQRHLAVGRQPLILFFLVEMPRLPEHLL